MREHANALYPASEDGKPIPRYKKPSHLLSYLIWIVPLLFLGFLTYRMAHQEMQKRALYEAAEKGDVQTLKSLLDSGARADTTETKGGMYGGRTLLIAAVQSNQIEAVRLLLERGADPNHQDSSLLSPLCYACMPQTINTPSMGRAPRNAAWPRVPSGASMVRLLLAHGADPNAKQQAGITILQQAMQQADDEAVEALLDGKANPNGGNQSAQTPLTVAVSIGQVKMVKALLAHGADVNLKSGSMTPLAQAIFSHNLAMVKFLVANGADISGAKGTEMLAVAKNAKAPAIARWLQQAGAK